MESHKLVLKFFLDDPAAVPESAFVPVFHSFIQTHALPDHLLIDVADYAHVPESPGVVLVAHEANYYLDRFDGRLGLSYSRKRPLEGTFAERLRFVVTSALEAAARLEETPALADRLQFRTDQLTFKINDRLLGPNNAETLDTVRPDLEQLMLQLYGDRATLQLDLDPDPRQLFEIKLTVSANPAPDLNTLLARVGWAQLASD